MKFVETSLPRLPMLIDLDRFRVSTKALLSKNFSKGDWFDLTNFDRKSCLGKKLLCLGVGFSKSIATNLPCDP